MMNAAAPATAPGYVTDPVLARAFVAGILESEPPAAVALDTIEVHCAERGLDPTLLVEALNEALIDGGAR